MAYIHTLQPTRTDSDPDWLLYVSEVLRVLRQGVVTRNISVLEVERLICVPHITLANSWRYYQMLYGRHLSVYYVDIAFQYILFHAYNLLLFSTRMI